VPTKTSFTLNVEGVTGCSINGQSFRRKAETLIPAVVPIDAIMDVGSIVIIAGWQEDLVRVTHGQNRPVESTRWTTTEHD
jgi:hypothetical protein